MTARLYYDRSQKEYHLIDIDNEQILQSWPPGPDNRQEATEAMLQHNDARAYAAAFYLVRDLFRDRPDLHGRIWRACEIVADGDVMEPYHINDEPHTIARVKSQSAAGIHTGRRYAVKVHQTTDGKLYTCDCIDFTGTAERGPGAPRHRHQPLCKHIIAVKLHKILMRPFHADEASSTYTPRQRRDHAANRAQYYGIDAIRRDRESDADFEARMAREIDEKRARMRAYAHNQAMDAERRRHAPQATAAQRAAAQAQLAREKAEIDSINAELYAD